MAYTFTQKKAEMRRHLDTFFSPLLREEGFVSYKDESFFWYKIKGDLLYKIVFPFMWTSPFLKAANVFGVTPLFSWEHIPPIIRYSDWAYTEIEECDNSMWADGDLWHEAAERLVGKLPKASYGIPAITHPTENGIMIDHLNTERCGAEVLDEMIFPVFHKLTSVEDVYKWNKTNRVIREASLPSSYRLDIDIKTEEDYIELLTKRHEDGEKVYGSMGLSLTFSEECLYCKDEKFYPSVLLCLKDRLKKHWNEKTKEKENENRETEQHVRLLIQMIESNDFSMLDAENARMRDRMLAQIRKKIPELKIE